MKNKTGFGKSWYLFHLKLTILDVWDILNGFITNCVTPRPLWFSKKTLKCRNSRDIYWIVIIKKEYSKYCSFSWHAKVLENHELMIFINSSSGYTIKFVRKVKNKESTYLNTHVAVCKRILNIYEIPCIHLW